MNILKNISYRAWYVWRRNLDVSKATWKTNVIPPIMEPVLYILAFGFGLGMYVSRMNYMGIECSYIQYIAPGMITVGVLFHSMFEAMYGSFVRMYYQKTFDAIVCTPLLLEDVLAGELLWGATKGLFTGIIMLAVISIFGLAAYPSALIIVPLSFVAGFMFAGFGLWFAAIAPTIDNLNLPTFLFVQPMFLFSATFFPIDGLPHWAAVLSYCLPLTHFVEIARAATFGVLRWELLWNLLYIVTVGSAASYIAVYKMTRRLIK